jgi:hypothetical protein
MCQDMHDVCKGEAEYYGKECHLCPLYLDTCDGSSTFDDEIEVTILTPTQEELTEEQIETQKEIMDI